MFIVIHSFLYGNFMILREFEIRNFRYAEVRRRESHEVD